MPCHPKCLSNLFVPNDNYIKDPTNQIAKKYYIDVSEECYHHWKIVREELNFKSDEDLVYHFLNLKRCTLSVKLE